MGRGEREVEGWGEGKRQEGREEGPEVKSRERRSREMAVAAVRAVREVEASVRGLWSSLMGEKVLEVQGSSRPGGGCWC